MRSDYASASHRVLSWVEDHRRFFRFSEAQTSHDRILLLKPFAELVLAADLLLTVGVHERMARDLLDWAWGEVDEGRNLLQHLAVRTDLGTCLHLAGSFRSWGYRLEPLENLVGRIARLASFEAMELQAWRRLALSRSLERLGLCDWPQDPLRDSWLAARPEPWTVSLETAYAVTHEVFYVTDFGAQPGRLPDAIRGYLRLWLPSWSELFQSERNADLIGEFSMAADCLEFSGWPSDPLPVLAQWQQRDGSLEGPEGAGRRFVSRSDAVERVRFMKRYHTSLVALMAFAMRQASSPRTALDLGGPLGGG